jgi:hypothetical protein
MAILSKGITFTTSQQLTSTNFNNLVDAATFVSGSSGTTDDSTLEVNGSGRLQIKDLGVVAGKLASNCVTTSKVTDGSITYAKLSTGAPTWNGTSSMTLTFADTSTQIVVQNSSSTGSKFPGLLIDNYNGGQSGCPAISLRNANGSLATPSATSSGDVLGTLIFSAHNGTSFQQTAQIFAEASENHSGSAEGTNLRFLTTIAGATSATERMRTSETGGILIGTTTDVPSAILTLSSTTKGLRLPVLTTVQRDAISSPAEGIVIFNTTTNKLNFYTGAAWEAVTSA